MDQMEMVEKLRQKANVSYEEARDALEKSEWDLLDALVYLEGQGKIRQEAQGNSYTTKEEPRPKPPQEQDYRGAFTRFFSYVAELINKANQIFMDARRNGKVVLSVPLTVLLLLLAFMFWWVVPIMAVSLFFGVRYSFRGSQAADTLNKAMDKAAHAVDSLKPEGKKDGDGQAQA